jgi:uncharacterized protein (TIGR02996 family)
MSRRARPEVLAFLGDVKEHPDDPTPWLVLTDWLEEHGDESDRDWAEYIRLSSAVLRRRVTAADWERGERRRELFRRRRAEWLGPLEPLRPDVVDGLLTLSLSIDQLLRLERDGVGGLEVWAWVTELRLGWGATSVAHRLAGCSLLAGVTRLVTWGGPVGDDCAIALARSPHLGRLTLLQLWTPMTPPEVWYSEAVPVSGRRLLTERGRRLLEERFGSALRLFGS